MAWVVSATPRSLYPTTGTYPLAIVQEAGWAPGPVWTGDENLAATGIRSPDRPARSESLYRVSYPGPQVSKFFKCSEIFIGWYIIYVMKICGVDVGSTT
jgi:hypothetical protein